MQATAPKTKPQLTALALSLAVTLLTLASLNQLANEEHAGTVLARAAAVQQAQASAATRI